MAIGVCLTRANDREDTLIQSARPKCNQGLHGGRYGLIPGDHDLPRERGGVKVETVPPQKDTFSFQSRSCFTIKHMLLMRPLPTLKLRENTITLFSA